MTPGADRRRSRSPSTMSPRRSRTRVSAAGREVGRLRRHGGASAARRADRRALRVPARPRPRAARPTKTAATSTARPARRCRLASLPTSRSRRPRSRSATARAAARRGRRKRSTAVSRSTTTARIASRSPITDGLESPGDTEYFIRTLDDRPPDVRILRPASDKQVTPLEEVLIEARADDDYGIASFDLVFQTPRRRRSVVPLQRPARAA